MPFRPPSPVKARKLPPIRCAFCREKVARPRKLDNLFSAEPVRGGRCDSCGAVFVFDETGKDGGTALMDGLTLACDGDMQRALTLQAKVDYRVASITPPGRRQNPRAVQAKIWFIELRTGKPPAPSSAD